MPHYHFNTLDTAKRLESVGFSWEQAFAIVRVIAGRWFNFLVLVSFLS